MVQYTGSGKVEILGCALARKTVYLFPEFEVREVVCLKYKANQGILRKIAIKEILHVRNTRTHGMNVFLYKDQDNALYNENELCLLDEAEQLIAAFIVRRNAHALNSLRNC